MKPALLLLGLGSLFLAGCVSQVRSGAALVGETGPVDRAHQRAVTASLSAEDRYEYRTPKIGALFNSIPPGADIEWLNDDRVWVTVGTTPSLEIVIEATGKPELFRVSMPGYLPQTRWVAATPGSANVAVNIELQRDLALDRSILSDAR